MDTNEAIFVQKAIAIKGLRIAIEEKDTEIRSLKRKARIPLRVLPSTQAILSAAAAYSRHNPTYGTAQTRTRIHGAVLAAAGREIV